MMNSRKTWFHRSLRVLPVLLIGAIVLAACGSAGTEEAATSAPVETPLSGRPAPDFTLTVYQGEDVLGGEEVQFSDVLGKGKPTVLNFWAGLCPPCRIEMPHLQSVYESKPGAFLLVGLDVGPFTNLGSRDDGRQLLQALRIDYPSGTTFDQSVMESYRVLGMPSTYFITPEGQIYESWSGLLTEAKFEELVDELISASG